MMTDAGSVLGPEMTAKAQAEFGEARGAKSILSAQSKSNASSEGYGSGGKALVGRYGHCKQKAQALRLTGRPLRPENDI
jgi:hypothetical protein